VPPLPKAPITKTPDLRCKVCKQRRDDRYFLYEIGWCCPSCITGLARWAIAECEQMRSLCDQLVTHPLREMA
jgi:hypothetical protein